MLSVLRSPRVEACLIALPFLLLYQVLAGIHLQGELGLFYNHYFNSDPRLYTDMFTQIGAGERRWMHPLLPILPGLPGYLLVQLGFDPRVVACGLTQLAMVACLVLFQLALRTAGCGLLLRMSAAAMLGLSFTTLLHGVLPESFVFGALVLLLTVRHFQHSSHAGWWAVLLAAGCYGTTVTNLGAWGGMALVAMRFERTKLWPPVRAGVLGLALMLLLWALYEQLFGGWQTMLVEPQQEQVHWNWPPSELVRLRNLGSAMFAPEIVMMPKVFAAPLAFDAIAQFGKLGTALHIDVDRTNLPFWPPFATAACLLLACSRRISPELPTRRLAWLLLGNLLMQTLVFFFYGDAPIAYASQWMFSLCGGVVLLARGLPAVMVLLPIALATWVGWVNVPALFDVVQAHVLWRDQQLRIERTGEQGEFVLRGNLPLDEGTAQPFVLFPDPRIAGDTTSDWRLLPWFQFQPDQLQYVGEGQVQNGVVLATGKHVGAAGVPTWISLRLQGTWRGYRVDGFTFPAKL